MNTLHYTKGDATQPKGEGNKIIVHICNDMGGWGRGFVMALSNRWKSPETSYREWHLSGKDFELGAIQLVQVEASIWVANVIGQHKTRPDKNGTPPIRYDAMRQGLSKVAQEAKSLNASVHMPRIGAGLAGGDWNIIEGIIKEELVDKEITTTVYDFG